MEPFTTQTGLVAPLDRLNVDTDQLVPKQFLTWATKEGYGRVLLYDWRYLEGEHPNPEFVLNQLRYRGASVLLCRTNFGCGSSREHAVWALLDYGFRVLIGTTFADIFYNNCLKNGILPLMLPERKVNELFRRAESIDNYQLVVDLKQQTIHELNPVNTGVPWTIQFQMDPFRRENLLNGLDDIGTALRYENKILEYERRHKPSAALFGSLTFPFLTDTRRFSR
jgi:3-isopropylmalate/(R)-2-methylmalate dehydratase small subunit